VQLAASVTLGSLLPFAAFANKINVKSEGERRLCGTKPSCVSLALADLRKFFAKSPAAYIFHEKREKRHGGKQRDRTDQDVSRMLFRR
jgi:hypothetical protein